MEHPWNTVAQAADGFTWYNPSFPGLPRRIVPYE